MLQSFNDKLRNHVPLSQSPETDRWSNVPWMELDGAACELQPCTGLACTKLCIELSVRPTKLHLPNRASSSTLLHEKLATVATTTNLAYLHSSCTFTSNRSRRIHRILIMVGCYCLLFHRMHCVIFYVTNRI